MDAAHLWKAIVAWLDRQRPLPSVDFAQLSYREHQRAAELQRIADERWAAFRPGRAQATDGPSEALTEAELIAASRTFSED